MEAGKGEIKGSEPKKLGASSYLLELLPDAPLESNEHWHHRMTVSQFQLANKSDEPRHNHEFFTSSHSVHWSGRDHVRDIQRFSSNTAKPRPSRSKSLLPHSTTTPAKSSNLVSKDRIIIGESSVAPGVPVIYRSPEERMINPDKLNLDRRQLSMCPILEGEERLRLLNLQHNSISRLQYLGCLRRLVFLDLYDNLVHEISGLEGLMSLRVLMLGRNRIRKISGLQTLAKLDVLDLHGNMIIEIEGLNHFSHLRVLNLAGNDISCVSGLGGLQALAELNLRRNRISNVYEMDGLKNLQRLFLSHNLIQNFDNAPCLSHCDNLTELTLDGNPLANVSDYRQSVIYHVNQLHLLDQTPVTEEERLESLASVHEEEEKLKEEKKKELMKEHKEFAVAAIEAHWKQTHHSHFSNLASSSSQRFINVSKEGVDPLTSVSIPQIPTLQCPSHFLEHDGDTLHLYGWRSFEVMDNSAPLHTKLPIQELHFHYIEFEEIARWLPKLSTSFPNVVDLAFSFTNMTGLEQVNALAQLTTPLNSLLISHGNPVTYNPLCSIYVLYRLNHLGLSILNGENVKENDLVEAEQVFGKLGQFTTTHLPHARLMTLIKKYRSQCKRKMSISSPMKSSQCSEPVSRVGLHHFSPQPEPLGVAQQERLVSAHTFCTSLLASTLSTHRKLVAFDLLWPNIMEKLVHSSVKEYSSMDNPMKTLLDRL